MNSNKMKGAFATVALAMISAMPSALAQQTYFSELNKTVSKLGAQADYFYVIFHEGFGRSCAYGVAYIAAEHKGIFGILLSAKMSGKTLSRIDYEQLTANGTCTVKLAELAP